MSLLTFFAEQRRRWFNQTKDWPPAHVDGGISALLKAEVAFMALPMYNAHQQAWNVQRELDEVTYKYTQARQLYELRATQLAAAVQERKEQTKAYKKLEKRTGQARRTLSRLAEVADLADFEPEVRLRYMQELLKQYFLQGQAQEAEDEKPSE